MLLQNDILYVVAQKLSFLDLCNLFTVCKLWWCCRSQDRFRGLIRDEFYKHICDLFIASKITLYDHRCDISMYENQIMESNSWGSVFYSLFKEEDIKTHSGDDHDTFFVPATKERVYILIDQIIKDKLPLEIRFKGNYSGIFCISNSIRDIVKKDTK